jgi:cobyrinic acid a,c-diamide synthase
MGEEIRVQPFKSKDLEGFCFWRETLIKRSIKSLVVAGTQSGAGKTTLTLGLMAALRRRGLRVAPFKVGPDFIDPGHHTQLTGVASRNLDGWMLAKATNQATFRRGAAQADIAVVEGVMGLYDGYDGRSEAGSTAQMAKWLGLPVLLVVSARSMARSAAALVQGFENFDPQVRFAGVVFNHLGSDRHLAYLQEAMAGHVATPCLGGLRQGSVAAIPERHLGLLTAEDYRLSEEQIEALAEAVEAGIDLDRLLEGLPEIEMAAPEPIKTTAAKQGQEPVRIAVARDSAFCFYYPENLELLAAAGAEIVYFSPLRDRELPAEIDGIYFGGGYPELHAADLAANTILRRAVKAASRSGMPIYGECGGFMYLCAELVDGNGSAHPMAGCFPFRSRMLGRLKSLGYREIRLARETLLGPAGTCLRGHEFHYSETEIEAGWQGVYQVSDRRGQPKVNEGFVTGRTLGSYYHLHFGSQPATAGHFVAACRAPCRAHRPERRKVP